jgi:hypothetical protein
MPFVILSEAKDLSLPSSVVHEVVRFAQDDKQ